MTKVKAEEIVGGLTRREKEVFTRIASGESRANISKDLRISPNTVAAHRCNIIAKLGLSQTAREATLAKITLIAVQAGLVG